MQDIPSASASSQSQSQSSSGVVRPPDPLESASLWSRCTFSWIYPLLKLGSRSGSGSGSFDNPNPLQEEDLYTLNEAESSAYNRRRIEALWEAEVTSGRRNFARALFWDYIRTTWSAQVYMAINMTARIGQAVALGMLMEQFRIDENDSGNGDHNDNGDATAAAAATTTKGYLYAGIMVLCGLIAFPSKQQQFFHTYRKGLQIRAGVVAAIYAKTLRLPSTAPSTAPSISISSSTTNNSDSNNNTTQVTSGHVINLASNDVERFSMTSVTLTFLLQGPFVAMAILILGMREEIMGPVFAVGYGLLLLLLPLQVYLSRKFVWFRSQIAGMTDARVGIISQAINGARVMKLNSWEHEFYQRASKLRSKEINVIQIASRYKALNEAIYFFSAPVISVFIFTIHVGVVGGTLTPKNVYTTLTLMSICQFILTKHLPNAIMGLSECLVSCRRAQSFLELPESHGHSLSDNDNDNDNNKNDDNDNNDDEAVTGPSMSVLVNSLGVGQEKRKECKSKNVLSLENVTCHWSSTNTGMPAAISNISMDFKKNHVYCIIGRVGSGKSALLQALAGELPVSEGNLTAKFHSLSYAAQEPWIMDGSVRENIIMGLAYETDWYQQVVNACGLMPDIQTSFQPHGDLTIVGDRGVQCSGGQKARIALARCLYMRESDVLLLDDPLSAVDSKVARTIYYDAILDLAVTRGQKCVILVTHQHQFVGDSTCILMENGRMQASGSFSDCVEASNGDIKNALQVEKPKEQNSNTSMTSESNSESEFKVEEYMLPNPDTDNSCAEKSPVQEVQEDVKDESQKEGRVVGIIARETWTAFGKELGGLGICIAFLSIFALTQGSMLLIITMLGFWAEERSDHQNLPKWFILILSLTAAVIILSILRAIFSFYLFIQAAQRLHDRMLQSVLRAKIEFFDTNPLGRILNRFSADVGILDETFPLTIYDFVVGLFVVLGGMITAGVVLPFILLCVPPLLWAFFMLRKIFVTTSRELKRIEGMSRSPIFATLSETLGGIATIRSNSKVEYFKEKFEIFQNSHTRAYFAFVCTSRWFAFQLDVLAFSLLAAASFLAVLFHDRKWFLVDPAVLGLALTLLIQISTTNFPWIVRQSAEVCNQMVSVERILDYGDLESELYGETHTKDDHANWPKDGSVIVSNLTTRYRLNLPVVLSGVSFRIESGQKIGVVGRSGCGKSTLIQAIFRLLEAEEGSIVVGGVDISTLPLQKLRREIAVIVQTPVLFGGCSIRENLDPFGEFKDDSIRNALNAVQMMDVINDMQHGLDASVTDGGSNFSVGQRQLLCLARSLLGNSRILILDEPTANVDINTDHLLQKTLKEKFSHATIISVAHRLDTIIDYDKILVLGDGKVLEYGPPKELLLNATGHLSSMVKNTGDSMSKLLHRKANVSKSLSSKVREEN